MKVRNPFQRQPRQEPERPDTHPRNREGFHTGSEGGEGLLALAEQLGNAHTQAIARTALASPKDERVARIGPEFVVGDEILDKPNPYLSSTGGAMGSVYFVGGADGPADRAIKTPRLPSDTQGLVEESDVHRSLRPSPNVLGAQAISSDPAYPAIAFPRLKTDTKRVTRDQRFADEAEQGAVLRDIGRTTLSGLQELHAQGWVHRDVKPDNLLVGHDGELKLGDLGIATPLGQVPKYPRAGTFGYVPPEAGGPGTVDGRHDVYAVGKMLGELGGLYGLDGKVAPRQDPTLDQQKLEDLVDWATSSLDERPTPELLAQHPFFAPPAVTGDAERDLALDQERSKAYFNRYAP